MSINSLEISSNSLELWLRRVIFILHKIDPFNKITSLIGMFCVFLMSAVIFVDVLLRYLFQKPIKGSLDIIEMTLVVAVFLGIAYAQHLHAHVNIDLVTNRLKPKSKLILSTITCTLSIGVFVLLSWRTFNFALHALNSDRVTQTLFIPWWPFTMLVSLGCVALLVVLLRDLLYIVVEGLKNRFGSNFWALNFGIAALVIVGLAFWALYPAWEISLPLVGLIGLVLFFLFFFLGMPIAFVMIMVGFLCSTRVAGIHASFDIVGSALFTSTANFTWATIALFVLMGYFCLTSGIGSDLVASANKWIGHIRGGLAMGTVIASTGFAAIVGDPSTPAVAIGSVAIPEMRKFKYSDELSTGSILAGSTIGAMIPPSLGFIIYGVLSGVSIGSLFVAGIIPGLLLCVAFIITVFIICRFRPGWGPPGVKSSWRDRFISLRSAGAVIVLFVLVIGGIYKGVFTPSEGAGVGAFGAFLIALIMRRLTWQRFTTAINSTGRLVALGFMIIGGAMILSYCFALSRLPDVLMSLISGLSAYPILTIIAMLLVYLILGFVMDPIPVVLLTVPMFAPIAKTLGFDLIYFGVLLILTSNLGFITPPYAGSIFILRAAYPDIPISTYYRGVIPFVVASIIVIIFVLIFPPLATWIPSLR